VTKYLLLYSGGSMPQSEAEQKQVMDAWNKWMGSIGNALVDGGNPFTPNAMSVMTDGSTKEGPVGEMMASGYSIIEADSLDAATKMAKQCPVLMGGAKISVFETFNVM
jgi:hypothetical protein